MTPCACWTVGPPPSTTPTAHRPASSRKEKPRTPNAADPPDVITRDAVRSSSSRGRARRRRWWGLGDGTVNGPGAAGQGQAGASIGVGDDLGRDGYGRLLR